MFALVPHPDTPPLRIAGITCSLVWHDAAHWCLDFIVAAPPAALRLPSPVAPARIDGLWRTTCFELFVANRDGARYREFNFSPSGAWAAYAFDGYRAGMQPLATAPPRIISSDPAQFGLGMAADLARLGLDARSVEALLAEQADIAPVAPAADRYCLSACLEDDAGDDIGPWHLNISAVIEEADGTKSYWALAHAPGPPDFHNRDCFIATLPAPDGP